MQDFQKANVCTTMLLVWVTGIGAMAMDNMDGDRRDGDLLRDGDREDIFFLRAQYFFFEKKIFSHHHAQVAGVEDVFQDEDDEAEI